MGSGKFTGKRGRFFQFTIDFVFLKNRTPRQELVCEKAQRLEKVGLEWTLVTTAYNLRRLFNLGTKLARA